MELLTIRHRFIGGLTLLIGCASSTRRTMTMLVYVQRDFPSASTLENANTVARELGSKYLWIDGRCIVQDDANNWETGTAAMSQIYSNPLLTISANDPIETWQGF